MIDEWISRYLNDCNFIGEFIIDEWILRFLFSFLFNSCYALKSTSFFFVSISLPGSVFPIYILSLLHLLSWSFSSWCESEGFTLDQNNFLSEKNTQKTLVFHVLIFFSSPTTRLDHLCQAPPTHCHIPPLWIALLSLFEHQQLIYKSLQAVLPNPTRKHCRCRLCYLKHPWPSFFAHLQLPLILSYRCDWSNRRQTHHST